MLTKYTQTLFFIEANSDNLVPEKMAGLYYYIALPDVMSIQGSVYGKGIIILLVYNNVKHKNRSQSVEIH